MSIKFLVGEALDIPRAQLTVTGRANRTLGEQSLTEPASVSGGGMLELQVEVSHRADFLQELCGTPRFQVGLLTNSSHVVEGGDMGIRGELHKVELDNL